MIVGKLKTPGRLRKTVRNHMVKFRAELDGMVSVNPIQCIGECDGVVAAALREGIDSSECQYRGGSIRNRDLRQANRCVHPGVDAEIGCVQRVLRGKNNLNPIEPGAGFVHEQWGDRVRVVHSQ